MEFTVNGRHYWIDAFGGDLRYAHINPSWPPQTPRKVIRDPEVVPVFIKANNLRGRTFRGFAFKKDENLYRKGKFLSPLNSVGGTACSVRFEFSQEEWVIYCQCEPGYGADLKLPDPIPEAVLIERWGLKEPYEEWLR